MAVVRPPQAYLGYFDSMSEEGVMGGAKVSGWGWSIADHRSFDRIVLVDEQDRIVGLARAIVPRSDVPSTISRVRSENVGWMVYARAASSVSAYGIIDGTYACKLRGSFLIGPGS
jgi:hypothetical protein